MSITALAWAAGLIDGEGCIYIKREEPRGGKDRRKTTMYALGVRVAMGHEATIERLRMIFWSGKVYYQKPNKVRVNESWSWVVSARQAEVVLRMVRPYLVTKAEEADIALSFMALPVGKQGGAKGTRRISDELLAARQDHYERLRRMKPTWRFRDDGEDSLD